ncbi:MAG: hypothetical protein JW736_08010 [Deltaproteobacteria bacterium]|nr:hypothetical protein [Deltaproteobacteria bacterium]MBN2686696.1 hypothetical protein [Deltaproteobacteria bacterium]
MIDRVKELYHHYYGVVMDWYNGLDQVMQYGVLFFGGVLILLIVIFFMLNKMSK